jgi:hypothetical protein
MTVVGDPIEVGFVASLAKPGETFIETHRLQLQQSPLAKIDLS